MNNIDTNIKNYNIIYSNKNKQKITNKIKLKKIDYIFSFRSHYIIKNNLLKKCSKYAINFHPGPPEYRGIGCANYALLNNSKFYGCTAHIINNKIDNGKILDVKKFKIHKKINLDILLQKTHNAMFLQAKNIFKSFLDGKFSNIKNKYKWSKKLYTKKDMLNLYNIRINMDKKKFNNLLRATIYKDFKPYISLNNRKFILNS